MERDDLRVYRGSARAAKVARWFGAEPGADPIAGAPAGVDGAVDVELRGGRIVLITGASGAGKSRLMRGLRARWRRRARWVDLGGIRPGDGLVVDVMAESLPAHGFADEDARLIASLEALSRVGLGEVWTYLRRPSELSEGQRWRLRLALAAARLGCAAGVGGGRPRRLCVLAADEFCALLDRVTAMVAARAVRRWIDGSGGVACAVVATSHDDLAAALQPDVAIRCDFGALEGLG